MKSCQKYINISISGGEAINEIVLLWVILYPDHLLWDYPLKKQAHWEVVLCSRESCVEQLTSGRTQCWLQVAADPPRKTLVPNPGEDRSKALEGSAAPYPGTSTLSPQWASRWVSKTSWVLVLLKHALGCLNRLDLGLLTYTWVKTEIRQK